jgi:hypothetical protein
MHGILGIECDGSVTVDGSASRLERAPGRL